jgi:hypothetical protein
MIAASRRSKLSNAAMKPSAGKPRLAVPTSNWKGLFAEPMDGRQQEDVAAHMWFNLAAISGFGEAVTNRDMVARHVTPAQLAEAQKVAREWEPTSTPAPQCGAGFVRARAKLVRWPAKTGAFLPTLSGRSAHTRSQEG